MEKTYTQFTCDWCGETGMVAGDERTMFTRIIFQRNGVEKIRNICASCLDSHGSAKWRGKELVIASEGVIVLPPQGLTTLDEVVAFGRDLDWMEAGIIPALRIIRQHFNLSPGGLATLLGVSYLELEIALAGTKLSDNIKACVAELFGTDGGAGSDTENNSKAKG